MSERPHTTLAQNLWRQVVRGRETPDQAVIIFVTALGERNLEQQIATMPDEMLAELERYIATFPIGTASWEQVATQQFDTIPEELTTEPEPETGSVPPDTPELDLESCISIPLGTDQIPYQEEAIRSFCRNVEKIHDYLQRRRNDDSRA